MRTAQPSSAVPPTAEAGPPRVPSYPASIIVPMTDDNPLQRFDRSAAAAGAVFADVEPDQLDLPTPCAGWTVRTLLNHVVYGNQRFVREAAGKPPVDPAADHLGDDPADAFRESTAQLRAVFAAEGALDRVVPTPFGDAPARMLLEMRVVDMLLHGWDAAKATGQSTDLAPELATSLIESFRRMRASGRGAGMFGEMQPEPEGGTAADRLAAVAGRRP
jgi:uncharacterized protein (TIGR03086 family)